MNKKGVGESLMFFIFILIMIIVSVGIVSGFYIFFGQGYDFREAEAEILANKFISCLDRNSERLNEGFDIIRRDTLKDAFFALTEASAILSEL